MRSSISTFLNRVCGNFGFERLALLGLTLLLCHELSQSARASTILSDPFAIGATPASGEYALGPIGTQNPTISGTSGAWGGGATDTVVATGLSYSDPNYVPAASGGSLEIGNSTRASRNFGSPPSITNSTTGTLYMSYLMQQTSTTGGFRTIELWSGAGTSGGRQLVIVQYSPITGSATNFGAVVHDFNDPGSPVGGLLGAANTNVNLFVVKFDLSNVSNGDSITVWQNPVLTAADPAGGLTLSGFDLLLGSYSFANFVSSDSITKFDELRFGTTWQDVAGVPTPEPSALMLLLSGVILPLVRRRRLRSNEMLVKSAELQQ